MGSCFLRVLAAIVLIPLFTLASAADEPEFATKLRPQIETKMQDWVTPGLMVLVDIPGKGTWIETFGTADLASKAKPDPEGHTHIGSVTAIAGASDPPAGGRRQAQTPPFESHMPGLVPNGSNIKLRQILDMTSGLYNGTEDLGFNETLDAQPDKVWSPDRRATIVVFADNQLEPNTNFILPADAIANVIVKELFP